MAPSNSAYEHDPSVPPVKIGTFRSVRLRAKRGVFDETDGLDLRDFTAPSGTAPSTGPVLAPRGFDEEPA